MMERAFSISSFGFSSLAKRCLSFQRKDELTTLPSEIEFPSNSLKMEQKFSQGSSYQRKNGFAQVARWIALDPDKEASIYRKFDALAARNLLYLQSELLVLENKLDRIDINDAKSDDMDLGDAIMTWETLEQQYSNGNEKARVRMDLIIKIRARIKEYRS